MDPVGALREVRPAAPVHRRDQSGRARPVPIGDPDDLAGRRCAGPEAASRFLEIARVAPERHDAVARRGPRRGDVDRSALSQPHRRTSPVRPNLVQVARLSVPGGVGDPVTRRGPGRIVLGVFRVGQTEGLGAVGARDPEAIQRRERDPRAIGRGHRVPNLPHREGGCVLDGVVELDAGAELEIVADPEGYFLGAALQNVQLPDLPTVAGHQMARVGGEGHARKHIEGGARLLVVVLHGVGEPALVAGLEVADPQPRVEVVTGAVDQPAAIGREGGADAGAVPRGAGEVLAGLAVVDGQLVLGELGIVGPVAGAPRVPDVAAARVEGAAEGLEILGLVDQLHARAAVHVVQPELGQAAAAEAPLGRDDVVAVRGPVGRLGAVGGALGDLRRVRAVERHDPDILAAAPVRGEDDARAVG